MQIEHQCPQCAGNVLLEESDRLLQCGFCKTRLYMEPKGNFRYYFSPAFPYDEETIFVPYQRFRGMHFQCRTRGVRSDVVDRNLLAVNNKALPETLGIRPQSLKLKLAHPIRNARFVKPLLSIDESVMAAKKTVEYELTTIRDTRLLSIDGGNKAIEVPLVETVLNEDRLYHEAFIAETVSLVYAPYFIRNEQVIDGITGDIIPVVDSTGLLEEDPDIVESVSFLSTICPNCAWDMIAERDSCILLCNHCNSAWQVSLGEFRRVQYAVVESSEPKDNSTYLPFWQIKADITGVDLKSYGDLARLANLPKVIKDEWGTPGLDFWIPAFKIAPPVFLRTAKQMTLAHIQKNLVGEFPGASLHPVSIPLPEAVESIKTLLTEIAIRKKEFMMLLDKINITPTDTLLVFYPFTNSTYEMVAEDIRCGVLKNALQWGKNI